MSQQMNEVLNSDTIRGSTDQNATFMFQPAEFRPPSKEGLFPCAQMASEERKTQESDDSKTSVSVKLEVRDSIEDEGSSNSRPPQCLSKESLCDAGMKLPASDAGEDLDSWKSNISDKKRDEKSDAGFDSNPEREPKDEADNETFTPIIKADLSPPEPAVAEKRKRRPRGRKSANASLRNYGADSPGDIEFDSPQIRTPPEGTFPTEKRKRGRPRGSRGTRGANSSFEQRSFNESTGILTDISSGEVTGDFSNVSKYEPTPPIIKIGRGALRPGCKSYRGRAACMGRGYKVEYDETPSWGVETGMMPVEYDSALSPLTDVDMSDRRQYSADACTPPFAKRARGTRKRGRGRSRGRARVSLDRSMDSDSSDFGVSRFETPDYSTRGCDTPELMDPNTESEVDAGDSVEKIVHKRRGRGRGSRGGRTSLEAADPDVALEATVTCAVCKETMTQQLFGYHKLRKHNNCSWREGIDAPLDLNDPKVVNSLLKIALQKKKQLTCEQCGISRSSLVGYQSHVTFCAKTEGERDALLETCPICKRRMMPSSLKVHMGVHRQEEKARELEKLQGTPEREDPGEGSSKNSGKSKRAAANRAVSLMQQFIKGEDIVIEGAGVVQVPSTTNMNELYVEKGKTNEGGGEDAADENKEVVISGYKMAAWTRAIQRCGAASCKNPGCTFKSKEVEKLAEHFKTCEHKPNINFLCKLCSFGCESKEGIQEHVKKEHMDKSGEGSDGSGSVVSANESEESDDVEEMEEISDEEHDSRKLPKPKKVCGKVDTSTQNKKTTRFFKNVNFLARQGYSKLYGLQSYVTTFHWTLEL
ncbi:hypothetical protein J437_LFUL001664 [Ladona fulva]|uniref:C2H2-type domain-containing protein n=1 Tax=Ladona fulva TaxID=123851 RepID=A0A8K0NWI5_LADFU|nr:hypothetical protein J437_LFUL001664 [Ladona fulva]